jgi:serpin B
MLANIKPEAKTGIAVSKVTVPMMSQVESLKYAEGNGYQAVELPYRDSNVSMLFILPKVGRFEEMEGAFSAESVTAVTESLTPRQVHLFVPKFTFESEFNLSEALIQMGMPAAFGSADFSGMTGNRDLFISDVVHKAFVAVDAEGTEAAAATAVIMKLTSAAVIEEPILIKLDRPFLFLIHDNDTGTILFIGRVLNPEA